MEISLIIFDMDGLLVDTEAHYKKGWLVASEKLGIKLSKEVVNSWVGRGISYTNSYLKDLTGSLEIVKKIRDLREEYFYEMLFQDKIELKKGTKDILLYLRDKNIDMALATSTVSKRAIDILKYFGLIDFFKYTAFGDEVERVKPAPDLYELLAKKAGQKSKNEILVIEDSLTGIEAAKNAGFSGILIPDSSFYSKPFENVPKNVIAQLKDLNIAKKYLEKIIQ